MSDISIDYGMADLIADGHRELADHLEAAAGRVPQSVDGGIAAEVVALMVAQVHLELRALADVSRFEAATIDDVVQNDRARDDDVASRLEALVRGLDR